MQEVYQGVFPLSQLMEALLAGLAKLWGNQPIFGDPMELHLSFG
jgi:hypothetical protein